ncbi:MAG: GcrA family cell cycle regulator [Pseudomonadota bacterium]
MSLAEDTLDQLAWADLTVHEKRDAVAGQLVEGRSVAEAAAQLSIIYGPIGKNHVLGIINRHQLHTFPAVVSARAKRMEVEAGANASRARARVRALPAPALPRVPAPETGKTKKADKPTLFDLKAGQCRRPLWGKEQADISEKFYCGAPAVEGKSYCAACCAELYAPREGPKPAEKARRSLRLLQSRGLWG